MMKLSLGFSPCPNDTYIFDALVNGKIDTKGLEFDLFMEDVQTLNEWAIEGILDCTKLSYGVLPLVNNNYRLLSAGGALGMGVGPLLITKDIQSLPIDQQDWKVAIPGQNTTAHVLFTKAYPNVTNKQFMLFHQIEDAVLNGEVDAGVIIHENRFTYQTKGLQKIKDLGAHWEETTQAAIPLGGIVLKREIPINIAQVLNQLIQESIAYSDRAYPALSKFIQDNAQEMSMDVMRQHIQLYVNEYSKDLGVVGKNAIDTFMNEFKKIHPSIQLNDIF